VFRKFRRATQTLILEKTMLFTETGLNADLVSALSKMGITEPTEIQEKTLALLLNKDLNFVGQARTGTGKTAAFVLPLLHNLLNKDIQQLRSKIVSLVLVPTRELAQQVHEQFEKMAVNTPFRSFTVFGGVSYRPQIQAIRGKQHQVIIGTPGRVNDLIDKNVLDLSNIEVVILDEADEMLNMGFFEAVQKIVETTHADKMTWMFSATMPRQILDFIKRNIDSPVVVKSQESTKGSEQIEQTFTVVRGHEMALAAEKFLFAERNMYAMVFCQTKAEVHQLTQTLNANGLAVDALHGDLSQVQRDEVMQRFKQKQINIMICTDVAARGIDVQDITHVFNIGLPHDIESYVHRIGRTGRAGTTGKALSIITPKDVSKMRRIEMATNNKVVEVKVPRNEVLLSSFFDQEMKLLEVEIKTAIENHVPGKNLAFQERFQGALESFSKEQLLNFFFQQIFADDLKYISGLPEVDQAIAPRRTSSSRSSSGSGGGDYRRPYSRGPSRDGGGGHGGGGYRGGNNGGGNGGGRSRQGESTGGSGGQNRRSDGPRQRPAYDRAASAPSAPRTYRN
jgi:ATP-dependent RNA helicase DeaD